MLKYSDCGASVITQLLNTLLKSLISVLVYSRLLKCCMGPTSRLRQLWDLTTGKLSKSFEGHAASITAVCLTKLGNQGLALSGSRDATLKLWDLESGKMVRSMQAHPGGVLCVASQGGVIVSGGADNNVKLWFIRNGKLASTLSGHTGPVVAVTLGASVSAEVIVSGSSDKTAKV